MRPLTMFALSLVAMAGGCGGGGTAAGISQADACPQAAKAACTKIFACSNLLLVQAVLMNETMCETTVVTNCGSTGFQCGATQTYHGDKAQQCKDQFNAQTCDAIAANLNITNPVASLTMSIPPCGQICTGAADASTGS